jgi:hypothetical protein
MISLFLQFSTSKLSFLGTSAHSGAPSAFRAGKKNLVGTVIEHAMQIAIAQKDPGVCPNAIFLHTNHFFLR